MEISKGIIYAEVFEILRNISKEKVAMIPRSVLLKIKNERDENYIVNIDWNKPLEYENFNEDTINILGYFKYNYWTKDESEKQYLKTIFKIQSDNANISDSDKSDIFKNNNKKDLIVSNNSLDSTENRKGIKQFLKKIFGKWLWGIF